MKNRTISDEDWLNNRLEALHYMALFMVPYLRKLYEQFDGDMVEIIVLGEISTQNFGRAFRNKEQSNLLKSIKDRSIDIDLMRPCNALSVSQASGIPRETVRRKVNKLIERGWLYRDASNGLYLKSPVSEPFEADNRLNVELMIKLGMDLSRIMNQ